jgi:hypothetical protein
VPPNWLRRERRSARELGDQRKHKYGSDPTRHVPRRTTPIAIQKTAIRPRDMTAWRGQRSGFTRGPRAATRAGRCTTLADR